MGCGMVLHFRHLMKTTSKKQKKATVVFEDKQGAVALSRSNQIALRTTHSDVTFRYVRSLVANNLV